VLLTVLAAVVSLSAVAIIEVAKTRRVSITEKQKTRRAELPYRVEDRLAKAEARNRERYAKAQTRRFFSHPSGETYKPDTPTDLQQVMDTTRRNLPKDGSVYLQEQEKRPLRVVRISWGRMEIEGLGAGKDFKLYPGGGRIWDWTETGTRHSPGIQPADVEELVARGATTIVLSQGMKKQLQVHPDTLRYLQERSVTVHLAETHEAVKIYNELIEDTLVAGLFHSTC
jgi:hypothetical protein